MKVGIVVYSYSGNTLSVAQKLEEAIKSAGHTVSIERVEAVNENPRSSGPVQLKSAPDIGEYDVIIFASPVHAFTLAPVMKRYLSQIPSLADQKTYCFVTQHFKKAWMGGNRAVRRIRAACKTRGADIIASGIVNWSGSARDEQIGEIVSRLGAI